MNPGNISTTLPAWWSDIQRWDQPQYYSTIQLADVDGDGCAELVARYANGILVNHFDPDLGQWIPVRYDKDSGTWFPYLDGPGLSDAAGWDRPEYSTIKFGDIDGDGQAELIARGAAGIITRKFNKATGGWDALPDSGAFTDAQGWYVPEYYSTIRLAELDGAGYLVGRGSGGIFTLKFDKKDQVWREVSDGPALSDDPGGWGHPQYYSTLRLATILDEDKKPDLYLIVRGAAGIFTLKLDKATNGWVYQQDGPALSDRPGGWDRPEYYSTIQLADIDGDKSQELIARGVSGILAWKFDTGKQSWVEMPAGPALSDANGWNDPSNYSTIQFADVDGDGCEELVARGDGGIIVWHYDSEKSVWEQYPDGPGWNDSPGGWYYPQYYSTIQLGDIDGDGQAELIARGAAGIVTWRCDRDTHKWSPAAKQFPAYTGARQNAYGIISKTLMEDVGGADIRSTYGNMVADLTDYIENLKSDDMAKARGGVPQDDWDAVRQQLVWELTSARASGGLFDRLSAFHQEVFFSNDLSLDSVANDLRVSTDDANQYNAAMLSLFGNIVWSLSGVGGLAEAAAVGVVSGVVGGLFSSAVGYYASSSSNNPIAGRYTELKDKLNAEYQNMSKAIDEYHQQVAQDWSLLGSIGRLVEQNIWDWTGEVDEMAKSAAWYGYALSLWQILTASVWDIKYEHYSVPIVMEDPNHYPMKYARVVHEHGGYTTYWLSNRAGRAVHANQLERLFETPPNGVTGWVATDPLGVSVEECLTARGGWNFRIVKYF